MEIGTTVPIIAFNFETVNGGNSSEENNYFTYCYCNRSSIRFYHWDKNYWRFLGMGKKMKTIIFIFICVVAFVVSVIIGVVISANRLIDRRYQYLDVNFTEDVGYVVENLTYGDKPLNNFDIYFPADNSKDNYSLIFYSHGGGFTGGDKRLVECRKHGQYLASKGYIFASVNYTYRTEGNGATILGMYEELMTAVHSVVKECESRGYHINEMATSGGSAGGCLAMLVAYKEPEQLPVPIKFVFEETGPASFEPDLWDMQTNEEKAFFINTLAGTTFTAEDVGTQEYQNAIDEISVATMINDNSVPILLAYGPKDRMVNPKAKYPLLDKLDEYKISHDFVEFPNSGHGLTGDPDKTKEYYQLMDEYLTEYFTNN
jgi:acetyl esterase/lipase